MKMHWIKRGAVGVAVLAVASLAVGSLSGKGNDSPASAEYAPVPNAKVVVGSEGRDAFIGAPSDDLAVLPQAVPNVRADAAGTSASGFGDRVIKSASLSVEVRKGSFPAQWKLARDIAVRFGGEVIASDLGQGPVPLSDERSIASGSLTIRVPASRLDATIEALGTQLGTVRAENVSSQDVSQEYVDLRSRLRNLRVERDALLNLYARANSVRDTLAVQNRLSDVQGQIEEVTGRIRFIERSTDFSTITLTIAEPGAAILPLTLDDDGPSFAAAWDTAMTGLVRIATTAMITALWLAPFALLAAAAMILRRRARPAPQA
jgi:hypothetical protein